MALKYLYVASGYKAGTAYGVLPNWANADFSSFSRNGAGSRVDKNGFITDVEANVPRLDHTGGGCPSLLLERTSTNYVEYSEDFTQSSWSKISSGTGTAPIVTANYAISPSGELNASRIQFDKGSGTTQSDISILADFLTVPSGIDATKSIYLKSATSEEYDLVLYGTSDASGSNVKKIRVTTEWQRFDAFKTLTGTSTGIAFGLREISVSGLSNTADVLAYAAQVEPLSYPTSYIPNYGNAAGVTRSEDNPNSTGDISSAINEQEGVFFINSACSTSEAISTPQWVSLSEGSSNNSYISIRYNTSANSVQIRYQANGGSAVSISTTITDRSDFNKIAFRWKANDFSLWINGSLIQTQTTWDIITANNLNRLSLELPSGGQRLYGKAKEIRIYDEYESDAEMVKLTTL